MRKIIDLTNQRFGRCTANKITNEIKNKNFLWECHCDCGKVFKSTAGALRFGNVKSCGCLKQEILKRGGAKGRNRSTWKGLENIPQSLYSRLKRASKKRNIHFELLIEDLENQFIKQNKKCQFSNIELTIKAHNSKEKSTASLDRIDSEKGYTIDNIQWIHKDLNYMKRNMPENQFFDWIRIIYLNKCT